MPTKRGKWKAPKWLERYRAHISTSGHRLEDIMNTSGDDANVFNNAPLALICVSVKSQVGLLERLHEEGLLTEAGEHCDGCVWCMKQTCTRNELAPVCGGFGARRGR